jgi:RNA polymerase sigma-70 factor (ECF subfamily)
MSPHDLFEILVREHAEMLMIYLRSVVRDAGLVDDLFQETMLTAWRRLDDYDKSLPFGPWLRGIAGKLILAQRRKSARGFLVCDAEVLMYLEAQHQALQRQPGDILDEKLDTLRDCLQQLPDRYRECIRLRYTEELAVESLAQRLELGLETVKKRLQRGRARLLACLQSKLALAEVQT